MISFSPYFFLPFYGKFRLSNPKNKDFGQKNENFERGILAFFAHNF
jgi:hypothetical protein